VCACARTRVFVCVYLPGDIVGRLLEDHLVLFLIISQHAILLVLLINLSLLLHVAQLDGTSRTSNRFEFEFVQPVAAFASSLFGGWHFEAHAVFLFVDGHIWTRQIGIQKAGALEMPIIVAQPRTAREARAFCPLEDGLPRI